MHLAWGDVPVDDTNSPTTLRIRLKKSKTDQVGNGVDVYVGRTDSLLCPVGAGLDYMAAHGSEPGSFFRFSDGSPLTKSKFTQLVCDVLQTLGLLYTEFAGHSFRIGVVTAAAKAGMEDSVIRSLGRWIVQPSLFMFALCGMNYGTAQFKLDKARVWHVLNMTCFSFRTRAGMRVLARLMT